ncbi:MAG: PEGA domain-containing protein [Candidatus Methanoperedens sp.]|nr:PEGA domain-containing protein [Candidatus Methanoperedens sp.]
MNDTGLYNDIRKILKYSFFVVVLTASLFVPPASSLENTNTSLNIESVISISNITDPYYYSLAKTAKIDKIQVVYFGMWSYDGSRLLIKQGSHLPGTAGLTAVYVMNADGTEIKEIASTPNNTKSKPLDMNLVSWSQDGNRIIIFPNIPRVRNFYVIADPDGPLFRVVGENYTTIDSIRENIQNIGWQNDFTWGPDGTKAFVIMDLDISKKQLYTVDENGFILKQLTNESIETYVLNAVWSHDGKKIAFNGKNLWIINEDGTGLKKLTTDGKIIRARTISWSPDDSKIFYQLDRSVRTINVDGTGATEIISGDNRSIDDTFSFSPEMQKIIFTTSTFHNDGKITFRFYVVDSDGRKQKLLSEVITRDGVSASWSPKGDKIALIENNNLYTINPDGSGRATIALSIFNYAWNPSGDYIAFSSAIDKKTRKDVDHSIFWPKEESFTNQVSISKPDGTGRVQITLNDTRNYNLNSWSPDGSRLLVDSFRDNILVIKFSGYDEVMSLHAPSSVQEGEEFVIQVKSMSKPVEKSSITLNGKEIGTTNKTGHLNYSFKEPGRYLLNASREGYRVANKLITVKENNQTLHQQNNTAAVPTADIPETPGFNSVFTVIALIFIIFLRRIR